MSVEEIGEIGEVLPPIFEQESNISTHGSQIGSTLFTLPHTIAMAHDRAQAAQLGRMNREIQRNNQNMRTHIYPILHEIEALLREGDDQTKTHDLKKALSEISSKDIDIILEEVNAVYSEYRSEFLKSEGKNSIEDGALYDLFPENLTEVSPHELKKIEGKVKEWLEHCKHFNTQKTQDLYLMIQIGVALLTAFQNSQREMSQSANFMVRNQRGG